MPSSGEVERRTSELSAVKSNPAAFDISLGRLKEGSWEDEFEEQIQGRVEKAVASSDMQEAEAEVEEVVEDLADFHRNLQFAAEKALLLQRDAILEADNHFIGKAEAGEATSKEDLQVALRAHIRKTFCRDHDGRPWDLLSTSSDQMKVYGPGMHLYFLFNTYILKAAFVAVCISIPLMLTHAWGEELRKHNGGSVNALVFTTAGNVGTSSFEIGSWSATDITSFCGVIDAIIVLIVYLSAAYFEHWVIPQVNRNETRGTATPVSFSVFVDCLPVEIGRGDDHEELLRAHFDTLLRAEVTAAGAMPGLRVLGAPSREEPDEEVAANSGRQSWGMAGQRSGHIVHSDGESCQVRWHDTGLNETVPLVREDGRASLVDAARLERMEQCRCAAYARGSVPGSSSPDKAGSSVHQVVLVRDFGGRFGKEEDWCPDEKAVEDLPVLGAFVVFRHASHRDFLLYGEYRLSRTFLGRAVQPVSLRLEGKSIRLQEAPAPSDIFWSNMDFPRMERLLRQGLIALLCSVMLMVCAIIFAVGKDASAKAKDQQSSLGCAQGPDTSSTSQVGSDCRCSRVGHSKVLADDPPGVYAQCSEWLAKVAMATAISLGSALVSTVVNFGIGFTVEFMAKFTKPKSVSHLELSIMQMTFVFKLLTLGVVVVLVNADFGITFLGFDGIFQLIGSGEFYDITPKWFVVVGWQVILINIFGLLNPVIFGAQALLYQAWCWWKMRKVTEWEDFKALYTPPQFPFAMQHAEVLSAVVVTLIFSGCMPILTVVLFARMALHCLADRLVLFRSSCIPPRYTHHLTYAMTMWLKLAAWVHSLMAIWVYGNFGVYPSYHLFRGWESVQGSLNERAFSVFTRSLHAAAFPNTCVLLFITACTVIRWVVFILGAGPVRAFVVAALRAVWRKCVHVATKGRRKRQLSMSEQSAFEQRPMEEMKRKHILHSYDPFDLPEYRSRRAVMKLKNNAKKVHKLMQLNMTKMFDVEGAAPAAEDQESTSTAAQQESTCTAAGAAKCKWPAALQDANEDEGIVIDLQEARAEGMKAVAASPMRLTARVPSGGRKSRKGHLSSGASWDEADFGRNGAAGSMRLTARSPAGLKIRASCLPSGAGWDGAAALGGGGQASEQECVTSGGASVLGRATLSKGSAQGIIDRE